MRCHHDSGVVNSAHTDYNLEVRGQNQVQNEPTVWIIDDDGELRDSLAWLLSAAGISATCYDSAASFLESFQPAQPGCVLVDLLLTEGSGLDLMARVRERGGEHPFVVMSGKANVTFAVESLRQGAVDFLEKPFDNDRLLFVLRAALAQDVERRQREVRYREIQQRLETLTAREREVMQCVVDGLLTKQIARQLNISEKTVEVHRSHITKKMHVASVAQLVRLVTEHQLSLANNQAINKGPSPEVTPPTT